MGVQLSIVTELTIRQNNLTAQLRRLIGDKYASKSGRNRGIASVTWVAPGAEVRDLS